MAETFIRIIKNDIPKKKRETIDKVDALLQILSENGVEIVKQSMLNSPATGNRYGAHIAASPGNPPRVDTEVLINSMRREKVRKHRYRIFTDVEYALPLEFGSVRWASGQTFPFMGPMALELRGTIFSIFDNFLE